MGSEQVTLFLGFPIKEPFIQPFAEINPSLRALFTQDGDVYLEERSEAGVRYLGKPIGRMTHLNELELMERNIYSLLARLFPNQSVEKHPLVLFVLSDRTP